MTKRSLGAESVHDNILQFTPPPRPLRAGVPMFDPTNAAHLRAWESIWDFAQREVNRGQ